MTIWRMGIACWITKATDTHSEYVILIAFPLQKGCTHVLHFYAIEHCLSYISWDALLDLLILHNGACMLPRNVGYIEPTDPVQRPRKEKILTTPQREPKITYNFNIVIKYNNYLICH